MYQQHSKGLTERMTTTLLQLFTPVFPLHQELWECLL